GPVPALRVASSRRSAVFPFHVFPAPPGALPLPWLAKAFPRVAFLCLAMSGSVSEVPWLLSASPSPLLALPSNQDRLADCPVHGQTRRTRARRRGQRLASILNACGEDNRPA